MASFYIPARLAYGAEGSLEERIPPNADLVYKVEILDIESELELALWLIEWKKTGAFEKQSRVGSFSAFPGDLNMWYESIMNHQPYQPISSHKSTNLHQLNDNDVNQPKTYT